MLVTDVISVLTAVVCLYGAYQWMRFVDSWPLRWAVVIALLINVVFIIARSTQLFTPQELNLFSAVRVLIMVLVLAVIPSSVKKIL